MNLMDEPFESSRNDKNKKTRKTLLICIIVLTVLLIAIMAALMIIKAKRIRISLDGQSMDQLKEIFIFEEDGTVHIPIRDMAEVFKYKSYNGGYIDKSEDTNSCYVESDEEIVEFTVNSDKIQKIKANTKEKTLLDIDKEVQMINGKLYTTIDGIEKAFNVYFKYDKEKNQVVIQTMKTLVENYEKKLIEKGYSEISKEYNDEKAILNGFLIVKEKGYYGVYSINKDSLILETKYSKISYIPSNGEFLVENDGKYGIISSEGEEKIKIMYDELELIDKDLMYYLVKKENKYGIINKNESLIIPIKYDEIGIDNSRFTENGITSKYIILDKFIPVKLEDLWGLYDTEGNKIIECKYDDFGCLATGGKNIANVLVIPDYSLIVGKREDKFYLVTKNGKELLNGFGFDGVYMKITIDDNDNKQVDYYVVKDKATENFAQMIERLKKAKN